MLRALILAPFLLVLVVFALSNQQPVPLSMWPTDVSVEVPVSLAVLVIAGVFFILGALIVWFPSLGHRRRARRAERRASALEAQLAASVPSDRKLLAAPR